MKTRNLQIFLLAFTLTSFLACGGPPGGGGGGGGGGNKTQCSDKIDNDNDGKIDAADADCANPSDNYELPCEYAEKREQNGYVDGPNNSFATAIPLSLKCPSITIKGRVSSNTSPNTAEYDVFKLVGDLTHAQDIKIETPNASAIRYVYHLVQYDGGDTAYHQWRASGAGIRVKTKQPIKTSGSRYSNNNYLLVRGYDGYASDYEIKITLERNSRRPVQKVFWTFDDYSLPHPITMGGRTYTQVKGFDLSETFPHLASYESQFSQDVKLGIRQCFADQGYGFGHIQFVDDPPSAGNYLPLFISGEWDFENLGLASRADQWNSNEGETPEKPSWAILYGDNFNNGSLGNILTYDEVINSFVNVACHEVGHSIGLNHTCEDERHIMTADCSSFPDLVVPNTFGQTLVLQRDVFPPGTSEPLGISVKQRDTDILQSLVRF